MSGTAWSSIWLCSEFFGTTLVMESETVEKLSADEEFLAESLPPGNDES
jgi:hypothetical protein